MHGFETRKTTLFSFLSVLCLVLVQLLRPKVDLNRTNDPTSLYSSRDLVTREDDDEGEDDYVDSSSTEIRSWGCNRNEAPFIFVHIGKAGGGSVRARMAASALNVTKDNWRARDGSFYPIKANDSSIVPGRFCNSVYPNARSFPVKTFEGTIVCHAETPLARAMACGLQRQPKLRGKECCTESDCHAVYVGHNWMGSELHWLPRNYLKRWWESNDRLQLEDSMTFRPFDRNFSKCRENSNRQTRSKQRSGDAVVDNSCLLDQSKRLDRKARKVFGVEEGKGEDWSFLYASLPVIRVTVVRDPFSWLISKFFWHRYDRRFNISCDDIETATSTITAKMHTSRGEHLTLARTDWVRASSLVYMMYLCGEDCLVRYERGKMDLVDIERQAASNLRQSFAVVGLLNESQTFYDMVTARVDYMNTTLNPHLIGEQHSTKTGPNEIYCKNLFADPQFQQRLINACEETAALARLYNLAVQVNRFQLEELRSCAAL